MSTTVEETRTQLVVCQMAGGPQDGIRHVFETLPISLVDERHDGYYKRTTETTLDGAHVFEYHSPRL